MSTNRGHAGTGQRVSSKDALAETMAPEEDVDPHIGEEIQGRYRIVRKLGEGGMGAVYEAEHLLIRRRVAIKLLHGGLSRDPKILKRFQNEAIAAASIGSPHIVEVTDMGRLDDGSYYMALEYLEGRDLGSLVDEHGALPIGSAVLIVREVCEGLEAAHAQGIVHRDLKPENVYLTPRGGNADFVKILDFGIAKLRNEHGNGLTSTGQAMGTPYYMPPEQVQGRKDIDERADIYALGVMLFHCLTGQFPFSDASFPMLAVKICHESAPRVSVYRKDVPERLADVIERMLAKEPTERFASVAEVAEALAPFAAHDAAPELDASAPRTTDLPVSERARAASGIVTRDASVAIDELAADPPASVSAPAPVAAETPVASPAAAPSGKLPMLVALGSLAVALAAVGVFALQGREPDAPASPRQDSGEAPPPAAHVETVRVQIETAPAEAELFLDGEPIPNPFDADLPRTDEPRTLEARLEGHVTASRSLVLRYPQRVRLELAAEEAEAEVSEVAPPPARRRARRRDPPPREEPQAAATTSPPPTKAPPPAQPSEPAPATQDDDSLMRVRF